MRLRDIAASVGVTERSAYRTVTGLTAAGYIVEKKDGRRNRYQVQAQLPLPEPSAGHPGGHQRQAPVGTRRRLRPPNARCCPAARQAQLRRP